MVRIIDVIPQHQHRGPTLNSSSFHPFIFSPKKKVAKLPNPSEDALLPKYTQKVLDVNCRVYGDVQRIRWSERSSHWRLNRPFEKYMRTSNWYYFPNDRDKNQNLWNHHLVVFFWRKKRGPHNSAGDLLGMVKWPVQWLLVTSNDRWSKDHKGDRLGKSLRKAKKNTKLFCEHLFFAQWTPNKKTKANPFLRMKKRTKKWSS